MTLGLGNIGLTLRGVCCPLASCGLWGADTALSLPAPKSPELHLEPLNCTTISVRWLQDTEDPAAIQGYKLFYKEEGQQENGPIFLDSGDLLYTLSGLGECVCIVQILSPPAAADWGRGYWMEEN